MGIEIHDWLAGGHETLACQFEGCGLSPLGDRKEFLAAHSGPLTDLTKTLGERNVELEALFDLQWTRMHQATALWRKYHPGNDLVQPDLGDLLDWLLEQIDELQRTLGIVCDMVNEHNPEILDAFVFMENIRKRGRRMFEVEDLARELLPSYHSENNSIRDHVDRTAKGWTVGDIRTCDDPICVEAVKLGFADELWPEENTVSDEHPQSGTEAPVVDPRKIVGGGPQGSNEVIGDPGQEQHPVPDEPKAEPEDE